MSEHARFIQKIYFLLEDCGMPDMIPERDLLQELYWMIQDHAEETGLDIA